MNTSLTESFGIAILEAACAGLYVVSTRVGGVPEVLPEDMVSFARPEAADVVRAVEEAVGVVMGGGHDPVKAHERIRGFYDWDEVTTRTERVYDAVLKSEPIEFMERVQR